MSMRVATFVLCSFLFAGAAFADLPVKDSDSKRNGSTRAKGSYVVEEVANNNVKITVKFNVRKSGISGTGRGVMVFEILDDSWEPVFKISKGYSVGADALRGTNDKDFRKTVTVSGNLAKKIKRDGIVAAFKVEVDKDTSGIPTSKDEWKEEIRGWASIAKEVNNLATGGVFTSGNWNFKKIK